MNGQNQRLALALGQAVIEVWGALPRNIQQAIFEQAVVCGHHTERDEMLREELAAFLHERHPRTVDEEQGGAGAARPA